MIITMPPAPSAPSASSALNPRPKSWPFSGTRSIACLTLTTYSTVHAMSTKPGSPAASAETRGVTIRIPASSATPASAAIASRAFLSCSSEPLVMVAVALCSRTKPQDPPAYAAAASTIAKMKPRTCRIVSPPVRDIIPHGSAARRRTRTKPGISLSNTAFLPASAPSEQASDLAAPFGTTNLGR
jgi:hypothetical protein